jgi:glucokinase
MPNFFLGLDLGGTNVKAGVVDEHGRIVKQVSVPTGTRGRDLAAPVVISRMVAAATHAVTLADVSRQQVLAVGVLSPGQASLERGIVFRSANLPLWRNVAIRAQISKGLGIPAVLENDANAAAYGEFWAGAGRQRKLDNLFMFTLGTGVGGGLVYEGKVVRGSFDFATEVGHMIMVPGKDGELCGCGQRGCLERYCSAKFTAERAVRQLADSKILRKKSSLGKIYRDTGSVTAADIAQHAFDGDAFARQVWEESCYYLALACVNVCHFIDPQMIVIGGGMSQAGRFLLDSVHKHFKAHWWKMTKPTATIALAKLGGDAGVIGAAGVAKDAFERKALPEIGR